ncbi:MAG TPA: helix-turn-helix transcriptional regulator [Candidatus Scubalenecus merdavium]|uniref:Helix-turn-helix transcriptional regulator n=1 Tax=Candidatus Scybalenecus merdavium TaxID=2840939 RepID=A0A9D1MVJ5_9FIRM|nr:helix-turn-helix transcriptional regulator [Candidatus Scubalenecus merdavium]
MVKNLKKLRKLFGVSQQQLADVLGVSQQSINKYENHNVEPDIETLIAMADYFDTSVDYLVGRTPPQNEDEETTAFLRTVHKMSKQQKAAYLDIGKTLLHYKEEDS